MVPSSIVPTHEKEGVSAMKSNEINRDRLYEQEKKRIEKLELSFSDREKALCDLVKRLKI